ncbi:hypothetical protein [Cyanobium sp. WAJ14-Wanaka]|uniref:hypothetical protein n=1 Tax=Cyanobium sp. WAJ14-Wanaka TaxID=2823725 RepID=UPI0020CF903C|nr:hypothetical protein [Cyanobium sp. WAJ14-Wanaka]MCP9776166.1 hypothetical protein [Cyanobium sp. WAJ14-Wanaka]
MQPKPFDAFMGNIHSQNGEDGVIAELLQRLDRASIDLSNWCVEYGAWDGKHLSNTFSLVEKGWNAVYIEGDSIKYKDLLKTVEEYPGIVPIEAFVARGASDPNSLSSLLAKTSLPKNFDLLSVDIDSYDLETWEGLRGYEPKIVVIEINSSIPPGVYHRCDDNVQGNSFTSTQDVAHRKGYELVCHTGNMIFVKSELLSIIAIDSLYLNNPSLLFCSDWLPSSAISNKSLLKRIRSRLHF